MPSLRRQDALRDMNDGVALFAAYATAEDEETWNFICECGEDGCEEWLELTLDAFRHRRIESAPVVADGHSESSRGNLARRMAAGLREQARALRAEARHQVRRARRAR